MKWTQSAETVYWKKNVQLGLVWSSKDQNKSVSSSVPKDKRALSSPGQWISQHPYSWYIGGHDTGSGGSVDWEEKNTGKINKAWLHHAIVIIQSMLVQIIMHSWYLFSKFFIDYSQSKQWSLWM